MQGNQQGIYCLAYSHLIPPSSTFHRILVFRHRLAASLFRISLRIPCESYYYPDHYDHRHYLPLCSVDGVTYIDAENRAAVAHFPLFNDSRASELSHNNSDECTTAFCDKPLSRISNVYTGYHQWRHNLSTAPTSCTTTMTEPPDRYAEEQPLASSFPLSSLSSEVESESGGAGGNDSCSKRSNDEEENASVKSMDCSNYSEPYKAYSTGIRSLNKKFYLASLDNVNDRSTTGRDSTICEKEIELHDGQNIGVAGLGDDGGKENESKEEEEEEEEEEDDDDDDEEDEEGEEKGEDITVSISLPFRLKLSALEKQEDAAVVDTRVEFTLKKLSNEMKEENLAVEDAPKGHRVKPTFIVTGTDEDQPDLNKPSDVYAHLSQYTSALDKRQALLSVKRHSREEVTDDEDSGVTSDVSRTDSECCPVGAEAAPSSSPASGPATRRSSSKYQRTQTHSRLFRLLSDEHLLGTSDQEDDSSADQSSSFPQSNLATRQRAPTRPKSLDCEALLRRRLDSQGDSYYRTWKSGERRRSPPRTYPRANVLCPRTRSAKNLAAQVAGDRQLRSLKKFPTGPTRTAPPSVPSRRC
jgi:hypothetical protein